MSSMDKKVVIITGASSGIGIETAIEFSILGCRLVLCGRNADSLKSTAQKCLTQSKLNENDIIVVQGDVLELKALEEIINKTIKTFGQLDVLVNNAGVLVGGGIENMTLEDYDKQMNVNVRSIFYLTQLAIPHLIKTKGNIVNVSSIAGLRSFPGVVGYCMSKAAVDQMTKCVALEVAARGIRVNSVNPGVIRTNIHIRSGMTEQQYNEFLEHSRSTHALGRVGTPTEVAKTIIFLASDNSSFITGVNLPVDGGRGVMCPR